MVNFKQYNSLQDLQVIACICYFLSKYVKTLPQKYSKGYLPLFWVIQLNVWHKNCQLNLVVLKQSFSIVYYGMGDKPLVKHSFMV